MNYDATQNQISHLTTWVRNISAYATTFIGIILSAIAFIILFAAGKVGASYTGIVWLVFALLILWIAWGLVEGNRVSWKIFQGMGAVLTGATGIVLVLYGVQDVSRWSPDAGGPVIIYIILWLLGGLILFIWATAQVASQPLAETAWFVTSIPFGIALLVIWLNHYTLPALAKGQQLALLASVIPILASLIAFRMLVRPNYHTILASLTETDDKLVIPQYFPSKYHELLARGRLCEIFELPCGNPCPLSTKVAMQYQQLKLKYTDSPQTLEALEKAYGILITPRSRELCCLAREIMEAKRKQLGDRVYNSIEILMWTKLWTRLQSNEFRGDPQRVKIEKQRLMKKF